MPIGAQRLLKAGDDVVHLGKSVVSILIGNDGVLASELQIGQRLLISGRTRQQVLASVNGEDTISVPSNGWPRSTADTTAKVSSSSSALMVTLARRRRLARVIARPSSNYESESMMSGLNLSLPYVY